VIGVLTHPEWWDFGDKTFVMSDQAGTAMFPQVGAEVTVFHEQQDGKNVITRIGLAQ